MFQTRNTIRMHDMDMAGILYFPRQFRFVHEALEEMMASEGLPFHSIFRKMEYLFVIVHCETDFLLPASLGDELLIEVAVEKIGTTSFTLQYKLCFEDGRVMGTAKTVHVCIDGKSRKPIPVTEELLNVLKKHSNSH